MLFHVVRSSIVFRLYSSFKTFSVEKELYFDFELLLLLLLLD